jgi:hypothetical protein
MAASFVGRRSLFAESVIRRQALCVAAIDTTRSDSVLGAIEPEVMGMLPCR